MTPPSPSTISEQPEDGGIRRRTFRWAWQRRPETPEQRQDRLARIRRDIRAQALAHFRQGANRVLVIAAPPGVGKSSAVAELGDPTGAVRLNLAWVCERHAMVEQVPGLQHFRHIQRCSEDNCPDWELHEALGRRGGNTWSVHKRHAEPCAYSQQFANAAVSAVYQLQHVPTTYPVQHADGIVVDECNLSNWLEPREVTWHHVVAARDTFATGNPAAELLGALARTLNEATLDKQERYGPDVFLALEAHCDRPLLHLLGALADDPHATDPHPYLDVDMTAPNALVAVHRQPPVVLPHVWRALWDEADRFRSGARWNSQLRIGPAREGGGAFSLYLTQPRTFTPGSEQRIPPRVILDATADPDLIRRLLDAPVELRTCDLDPPPHLQHLAVRVEWTGGIKGYSKTSLVWSHNVKRRERAIAEIRAVLDPLDPDGSRRAAGEVGLITFDACEHDLREALGIPAERSGHFWAQRGSNAFRECPVLLVVGTPALPAEDIFRMANVLYADDPEPLVLETVKDASGGHHYTDSRCQHLADYLSRAELTQCAHRNRPLCYDHRTVITFCRYDIDFLPATQVITHFPKRLGAAASDVRLERAAARVRLAGQRRSVATLEAALRTEGEHGLRPTTIRAWLRTHPEPQRAA